MKKNELIGSLTDQDVAEEENGQFDAVMEVDDVDVAKVAGGKETNELMCDYMDN